MIIIGNKSGRLGNRLFVFAHFIANAEEHGYSLYNPSFDEYAEYFEGTYLDVFCRFPAKKSWLKPTLKRRNSYFKFIQKIANWGRYRSHRVPFYKHIFIALSHEKYQKLYIFDNEGFKKNYARNLLLIAEGWLFKAPIPIKTHAKIIRKHLTPIKKHSDNVSELIAKARKNTDILIGVHIRQGDYKNFAGGIHFHSHQAYIEIMQRVKKLFPNKKVRFLICSDAPQDPKTFEDLDCMLPTNHFLEDMYSLASCDYIVGVPSTYTLWASFFGEKPLYQITDIKKEFTLNDFFVSPFKDYH